jgi:hypothetical protein
MNPSNNETAGMKLPPPVVEQAPGPEAPAEALAGQPETGPAAAPERAPGRAGAPQMTQPAAPPMAVPMPPTSAPIGAVANTTTQTITPVAADSDLIEKEWVNKAKQIVENTRDDPYKQSEGLTVVKVDYMKKRYNKTLKLK